MIVTRVKRLLRSVEEASSLQIAADIGADREIVEAALEHLRAMGKVTCRRMELSAEECREKIACASCPLVPVCDPKAAVVEQQPEEMVYAWQVD